jgi:hypothetical protein
MTRMVRIDVEYCILLTPARSAAAYAHQVHRKAMIVGLKSSDIKNSPYPRLLRPELIPGLAMTNEGFVIPTLSKSKGKNL